MPTNQDSDVPSQFQGLIDNLREKAVEEADTEAGRVLGAAEKRASEILTVARKEAEDLVANAKAEAEKLEAVGHDALKRASRDVLLSMESAITDQLNAVLHRETQSVVSGEVLAVMVRTLVEKWDPDEDGAGKVEVLLNEEDLRSLESAAWHGLKDELLEGVSLRPIPGVEAGLQIGRENGAVHYDFTAKTLAEWMGRFVTPQIRELLREVAEEKN